MEKIMTTREELAKVIKSNGISQTTISKAVGVSTTTISLYLDGKYPGDLDKMDRLVKGYLLRFAEECAAQKFIVPIVKTTVMKNLHEVLRFCHISRKMGIAYGESGIGKTTAEKEYVNECPETILIEADPAYTERDMFRDLHNRLIGESTGSVHQMFDACVDRLKDSGRLVIVDEAENLPYKALNMLRRIFDKAGIGIVMVGMPRLRANIVGDKRNFTQLYSRISISKNLKALQPEDVEEIVTQMLPKKSELWTVFHSESQGIARNLANLMEQSLRLANDVNKVELSPKVIKLAAQRLII